jgi:HPt (histidine-containing phosphotransfer) domain-containing protein
MRSAVAEGDGAELMTRAHKLKGSGGLLGAMAFWSLCERLEALGRSADMAGALELVDQIEREAVEIQIVLDGEERRWTA